MQNQTENPFAVQTPETMSAQEIVKLFVEVSDLEKVERPGHVFIHGHRGSGKSMIFRMLAPDCQMIKRNCALKDLPYFGVYLSIKLAYLDVPEFERLKGQTASHILSEHMLVTHLMSKVFATVRSVAKFDEENDVQHQNNKRFFDSVALRLKACGWSENGSPFVGCSATDDFLVATLSELDKVLTSTVTGYLQRLPFHKELLPYDGPLLGFQNFLLPLLRELNTLEFMPRKPVYLLIDDADNLNFSQTQVLNSWVSQRTTDILSLKISTQLSYKTYMTTTSRRIEVPHDYSEIHASSVLTGATEQGYPDWVSKIVSKRLAAYSINNIPPKIYFPEDPNQVAAIDAIAAEIRSGTWTKVRGFRPNDDVYRYARPEYIRRRGGATKHTHDYSYSGFIQLVHLSSGIIRQFLEPASLMFTEQQKRTPTKAPTFIAPDIQSRVLKDQSNQLMFYEFDKLSRDLSKMKTDVDEHDGSASLRLAKLRNLVEALGATFYRALIDEERAERRYFSILLNDNPDEETLAILQLGVNHGYFYEASIGAKDGMGRTRRFVLTRRLAPYFNLDPIGFSGYLSVTNEFLTKAMQDPKSIRGRLKDRGIDLVTGATQLTLEFDRVNP